MANTTPLKPDRRSFTVAEVAQRNGLGERTVWSHIATGALATVRLSQRCTRVLLEDEERWLKSHARSE